MCVCASMWKVSIWGGFPSPQPHSHSVRFFRFTFRNLSTKSPTENIRSSFPFVNLRANVYVCMVWLLVRDRQSMRALNTERGKKRERENGRVYFFSAEEVGMAEGDNNFSHANKYVHLSSAHCFNMAQVLPDMCKLFSFFFFFFYFF